MGIFDSLKNIAESTIKREASKTIANAVNSIGKGKNRSERFSFTAVPQNLSELQALPEAILDTPFKTWYSYPKRIFRNNYTKGE